MKIGVLKDGDKVISVSKEFIAIQRINGEVDIIPIVIDGKTLRVDTENIITIGYGDNVIEATVDDVTITTF